MSGQEVVREMYLEGMRKWPSFTLSLSEYARYCEDAAGGEPASEALRKHAADLYLCCACARGDSAALEAFRREAEQTVHDAIARVHHEREFVQEVQQELFKKLLVGPEAKVKGYRGRGPLQAWVRVAGARLALDRRRAECTKAGRAADLGDFFVAQAFGPESALTRARFHEPFRDALRQALTSLTPKDRNLLRMHLIGRCSIDQIGRAYNVHRATAARWLEQANRRILELVRRELRTGMPRLTDSEFQSVARVVAGELELDFALLRADPTIERSSGGARGAK